MAQIFHRSTNTIARFSIFGAVFLVAGALWVFSKLDRSSYNTRQGVVLRQPVPFSHDHHVGQIGIDCRYCHTTVEVSAVAGVPSPSVCMNCHKEIWKDSPMLEPVRASFAQGRPIEWTRVHDLPDFVYFDHSIHVAKGVGCASCHGPVDRMPLMAQEATLQMEWCVACHRNPERHLRPRSEVFNVSYRAPAGRAQEELGKRLMSEYRVKDARNLMSCSTCHR
jgi:hypothetical protein